MRAGQVLMSKTYRPYEPDQQLLLPTVLQGWLPPDHLAYFISDVVDQLDLSEITARYEEERGGPPYHPRMMVKVLLSCSRQGISGQRKTATRTSPTRRSTRRGALPTCASGVHRLSRD